MDSASSRPERNQRVANGTIAIILGLAFAVVAFAYFLSDRTSNVPSSDKEPDLILASVADIDTWLNAEMRSSEASIALLNVWATWCEPCRTEMPELAEFQKQNPQWPLFLVSADNETDLEEAREFLRQSKVNKPSRLIRGDQSAFIEEWRIRSNSDPLKQWSMSLPVTFFVDQNGKVLKFIAAETTRQELEATAKVLIRELPAEKSAAPDAL
jgi:thiol-disulfide isomerase/thioredoxin